MNVHEKLESFILDKVPSWMSKYKIPGFSIAVVEDDNVIFAEGFGARNVELNLPATPNTLYGVGSITKSFVAIGILQLVEKGLISLDDPANKYIPLKLGFEDAPITIHHLLTHSSGIPSLGTSTIALLRGIGLNIGIPFSSTEDFYRHINNAGSEVVCKPGIRFFYLNAGYRMLGHIIQKVSGISFHEYVDKNILKPIKMYRSTFSKEEFEKDPDRITPYRRGKNGKLIATDFPYPEVKLNPEFSFIAAAGGLISSVMELANYIKMNVNDGVFDDMRILGSDLIKSMRNIYVELPRRHFGRCGYGYGWRIIEDFFGEKMVVHGGSILVSTAFLGFIPSRRIGVAMASNIVGFPYEALAQAIFAILMGKKPESDLPLIKIMRKMELLTGRYESYRGLSKVDVVNRGGLLYLIQKSPFGEVTVPLIPEDDDLKTNRFYIWSNGVRQPVEFMIGENGKIDLFIERNRYHKV
ncbi:MAG: serine hydrolase [Candidatus Methanomethylicota archaeon]|nr:MAG: serine hydrolase [Candidatus Verstraetearchaeota archaeon]